MEDEQRDRLSRRPRRMRKGRPLSRGILEREGENQERADRDGSNTNRRYRREAYDVADYDDEEDVSNR